MIGRASGRGRRMKEGEGLRAIKFSIFITLDGNKFYWIFSSAAQEVDFSGDPFEETKKKHPQSIINFLELCFALIFYSIFRQT